MRKRAATLLIAASLGLVNLVIFAPPASACSEELGGTACTRILVCQVSKGKACL